MSRTGKTAMAAGVFNRSNWLFVAVAAWSGICAATLSSSVRAQTVRSRAEIAAVLAIERLSLRDGAVAGEIHNRSPHTVRDVVILVRYTWFWDDEFKPGKEDPGRSAYHTLPKEIGRGERLPFTYSPSPPLAIASGGHFKTAGAIAEFAAVIPRTGN